MSEQNTFPEDEKFPLEPAETPVEQPKPGIISGTTYDLLKRTVQFVLPAAGAFYFALATIWGLPAAEQVVGTIAAVTVFLSVILGISNKAYQNDEARFDGEIEVEKFDDGDLALKGLSLNDYVFDRDEITIKVRTEKR